MAELVLMIGIPGIGKSTFRSSFLPYHGLVNLDSIHALLDPENGHNKNNNRIARTVEKTIIVENLKNGIDTIVDATNIDVRTREKYFAMADGHKIKAVVFPTDVERAIYQNTLRERKVPEKVIRMFANKFENPTTNEGFDGIYDSQNPTGLLGEKPALFIDRDGVLVPTENGYVNSVDDLGYYGGAINALQKVSSKGYQICIISNQGGVGLGFFKQEELDRINNKITADLVSEGVDLAGIYCCTHKPKQGCYCRKPNTGMIVRASKEHNLDPTISYMVGDMASDIIVGNKIGCTSVKVNTGVQKPLGEVKPDMIYGSLVEFIDAKF
jgi:D-glycero-D-manno-heptose 1,7-bisphosphate phosphatase